MSITVAGHEAEGPYSNTSKLENKSGVYLILTRPDKDSKWKLIDVGESKEVRDRIEDHDREDCWDRKDRGLRGFAVIYTPGKQKEGRMEIEQDIRSKRSNLCGKR